MLWHAFRDIAGKGTDICRQSILLVFVILGVIVKLRQALAAPGTIVEGNEEFLRRMLNAKTFKVFPVKYKLFGAWPFVLPGFLRHVFQVPSGKLNAAELTGIPVKILKSLPYVPAPAFRIIEKGHGKFKGSLRRDLRDGHA